MAPTSLVTVKGLTGFYVAAPMLAFLGLDLRTGLCRLSEHNWLQYADGTGYSAGIMDSWPALTAWQDWDYLADKCGQRTVPVEVGSNYLADAWGQQLMLFSHFLALLRQPQGSAALSCMHAQPDLCPVHCCTSGRPSVAHASWQTALPGTLPVSDLPAAKTQQFFHVHQTSPLL